jgi:hypothetical protein
LGGKSVSRLAPKNALFAQISIDGKRGMVAPVKNDRAEFDFSGFPPGRHSLRIHVLDLANRAILAEDKMDVTVAPTDFKPPLNACLLDSAGNAIVNGGKFMPLGIYCGNPHKYELDRIAAAGFNCVTIYGSMSLRFDKKAKPTIKTIKEVLDYCHSIGLKVVFNLKDVDVGVKHPIRVWEGAKNETDIITKAVDAFKNHPAILAWYLNDEKAIMHIPAITKRRELINRLDPYHPTWGIGYQYDDTPLYGPSCDITGADIYPIKSNATCDMRIIGRAMKGVLASGQTSWCVPQLFNYAAYQPKEYRKNYRAPTSEEMRSQFIELASYGVKGFVFYAYEVLSYNGKFRREWSKVRRLISFANEMAPFVLSTHSLKEIVTGSGARVVEMTREDGRKAIFITAEGPGLVKVAFTLPNADEYISKFGRTTLKNGEFVFSGENICSDVLIEKGALPPVPTTRKLRKK